MELKLLILGGYGQFVWPAFIFTFVSFFLLYIKTKNELKKLEKVYMNELEQILVTKTEIANRKKFLKKGLVVKPIY